MPRILIVEDDDRQRAMIALILSNAGYQVTEAVSVKTALMHLDLMDLSAVVLDLRLPNGHGRKVVESLIAKRDDVPVIVLTAFPDDAPKGFPVTSILDKLPKRQCAICGGLARASDDKCQSCGGNIRNDKPFRERLMMAVTDARKRSDEIRSIRTSIRKLGDVLGKN
jgi:CheY-like chemotaxis protein